MNSRDRIQHRVVLNVSYGDPHVYDVQSEQTDENMRSGNLTRFRKKRNRTPPQCGWWIVEKNQSTRLSFNLAQDSKNTFYY